MPTFISSLVDFFKEFIEKQAFGVCAWWGEKLEIKSSRIRLFFIYISFLTAGSPIVIYLAMAFVLELKNYLGGRRTRIWDL